MKRVASEEFSIERIKSQGDSAAEAYTRKEFSTIVLEQVEDLPKKLREVVLLYYMDRFSIRRAAGFLGIGESAMKMRLSYVKAKLRQNLNQKLEAELHQYRPSTKSRNAILAALPVGGVPKIGLLGSLITKGGLTVTAISVKKIAIIAGVAIIGIITTATIHSNLPKAASPPPPIISEEKENDNGRVASDKAVTRPPEHGYQEPLENSITRDIADSPNITPSVEGGRFGGAVETQDSVETQIQVSICLYRLEKEPRISVDQMITWFTRQKSGGNSFTKGHFFVRGGELIFNEVTLSMDDTVWKWNGKDNPPDELGIDVISALKIATQSGMKAQFIAASGKDMEYLEKLPDGSVQLKKLTDKKAGIVITVKPVLEKSGLVKLETFRIKFNEIKERKPVEGATLDVGRPVVVEKTFTARVTMEPDRDYGILYLAEGEQPLLVKLRVEMLKRVKHEPDNIDIFL